MLFALFMIAILVITGLIWLLDILVLKKNRAVGANEPVIVEYAKSFFPVIFVVFFIRSFVVEPFKIPSGSMMPTLLVGDYILVNKFTYGLRVPVLNNTFIEIDKPKRGDVFVFHYPPDPSIDYIKRVVGLPGDKIKYEDKQLTINGQKLSREDLGAYEYVGQGLNVVSSEHYKEYLGDVAHSILINDATGYYERDMIGSQFMDGNEITVPQGHYFAMGDNRDNSSDSRVWGFVPEQNLVGRAFFIWMNFDYIQDIFSENGRIGTAIQ
jgi:signal peptidase I